MLGTRCLEDEKRALNEIRPNKTNKGYRHATPSIDKYAASNAIGTVKYGR
jgi:hypothetical protein